jgi:hypothetical protein
MRATKLEPPFGVGVSAFDRLYITKQDTFNRLDVRWEVFISQPIPDGPIANANLFREYLHGPLPPWVVNIPTWSRAP